MLTYNYYICSPFPYQQKTKKQKRPPKNEVKVFPNMGSGGTISNRYRVKDKMDSGEGPSPLGPERLGSLH